jgi:hypothetical protein
MSALLGAFSVALFTWLAQRRPSISRVLAVALAAVLAASLIDVARDAWLQRPRTSVDFGARVQAQVAWDDCIFADPPDLALAGDRLPVRDLSGTFLVDPFGALLVISMERNVPGTTPNLLAATAAQERLKAALSSCRYVALGSEPTQNAHMSPETADWFQQRFQPVASAKTPRAVLWEVVR